ncbi:MAG TPA: quinone-dependent dihydroorotate dehydrogenase [Phenylobacterium sp.]|uniref:quinone-dependent dihydroorotate dehydrogenase n=1 Tax=Phenylobacterium sp. TaxID=1871053 RepID=UPI002C989214|nr:quinone-dependent dihydroorotate dehydrogenase [Phenylobacterium sp.]HXA37469.1 quinone-dependent dihydroorotate dehydrogenase [Phenylobacterium sp.]
MSLHGAATWALRGLDPEDAHGWAIKGLKLGLGPAGGRDDPILATSLAGLSLPNPVGLAPGFDKDAEVFAPMLRAGFGFAECGTVTPLPQAGNPRPRLFRLSEDRAVINRMGFNNKGLEAFAGRLARRGPSGVVGANIGANKDSADRIGDYVTGLTRLWGLASYFTINISSPNTPGLRALQTKAALEELLGRLAEAADSLPPAGRAPMFLKVAPDLEAGEVETIAAACAVRGLAGIMVSNTTVSRPPLTSRFAGEAGGLSGAPLTALSTRVLGEFAQAAGGRLALVGVGGIGSGADAYAKIRAGACAVQLYSALVFEGPGLVGRIKRDLAQRLRADGFASVGAAVGAK